MIIQLVSKYWTRSTGGNKILAWKFKALSEKSIKAPTASNDSLATKPTFIRNVKIGVRLEGGCLKQIKTSFDQRNIVHFFILSKN